MRMLNLLSLFVGIAFFSTGAQAGKTPTRPRAFKVTTFNIQWYGLGGDMKGSTDAEHRDTFIREFLDQHFPDTDVFAFQEIVDVERLSNLLPDTWTCLTYDSTNPRHQHVVLCHREGLLFLREPGDNNDIIDEVASDPNRSRPALRLLVAKEKGPAFARIITVHLKAFPDQSQTRLKQVEVLAKSMKGAKVELPTVILGDFNAYRSGETKNTEDDKVLMDQIFKKKGVDLVHVPNPAKNTYRKGYNKEQLDHIWISSGVQILDPLRVWSACNSNPVGKSGFQNIDYYNEHISDHCPVTVGLGLN